ncbi:MAG TPA: zf-HC2 domain-containing protein, partial [Actinomycetota bacterium]|nr:zf-HC2 domain-containing protein [Actinomycetota bacterium]
MNCERVQALVSAWMDGVYLTASQAKATDVHVGGCARCRAFEERSARVRTAVRIRPAEQVPDLTAAIMDRVVREGSRAGRGR